MIEQIYNNLYELHIKITGEIPIKQQNIKMSCVEILNSLSKFLFSHYVIEDYSERNFFNFISCRINTIGSLHYNYKSITVNYDETMIIDRLNFLLESNFIRSLSIVEQINNLENNLENINLTETEKTKIYTKFYEIRVFIYDNGMINIYTKYTEKHIDLGEKYDRVSLYNLLKNNGELPNFPRTPFEFKIKTAVFNNLISTLENEFWQKWKENKLQLIKNENDPKIVCWRNLLQSINSKNEFDNLIGTNNFF